MKNILKNLLFLFLLLFIITQILIESESIMACVSFAFDIWLNNIFPSLFPFFIISELLINYGFVELIGEVFKPIMVLLFKTSKNSAFVFIMSMLSGTPSSAKNIRELYLNNMLDEKESSKLLMFCNFANPLFILGPVSIIFLQNKDVGILILVIHYLSNFIIGIIFRNYNPVNEKNIKINFKTALLNMHKKRISNKLNFGKIITNSLINSMNTLLLILGVITLFSIITTIIDKNINLNNYYQSVLNGVFEMTQGLRYIGLLDIPLKIKSTLSVMIISFSGFSVHMQVISILSDTKIKYIPFLTARIIHSIISGLLLYFTFDFWVSLL